MRNNKMSRLFLRKMCTYAISSHPPIHEFVVPHLNSNIGNILITIDRNTENIIIEHETLSIYDREFLLPKIKGVIKRHYPNYIHC
jgi:hypothetical protein